MWHADAAFAVHPAFKSHTGATMTMGGGTITSVIRKPKLNTKSSTAEEIVAVDDVVRSDLLTRRILEAQGYGIVILLHKQLERERQDKH
jgi:hypothetical protein